jgi:hypothetical protein
MRASVSDVEMQLSVLEFASEVGKGLELKVKQYDVPKIVLGIHYICFIS